MRRVRFRVPVNVSVSIRDRVSVGLRVSARVSESVWVGVSVSVQVRVSVQDHIVRINVCRRQVRRKTQSRRRRDRRGPRHHLPPLRLDIDAHTACWEPPGKVRGHRMRVWVVQYRPLFLPEMVVGVKRLPSWHPTIYEKSGAGMHAGETEAGGGSGGGAGGAGGKRRRKRVGCTPSSGLLRGTIVNRTYGIHKNLCT